MSKIEKTIIKKAIQNRIRTKAELNALKRKILKETHGAFPRDLDLLKTYRCLVRKHAICKNQRLENLLTTRSVRTLSGIAAITVLTKPYPCPGKCVYCPDEPDMPKSYLKNEPAAHRAYLTDFNPSLQVKTRLASLNLTGHNTEKIELIILGGSFPSYPKVYQKWFVQKCFAALNQKKSKTLTLAQKKNETAKHRCIGLSIETRPDQVNLQNLKWWRTLGITRVEIGVQTIFDPILKLCRRGHTVKDITRATRLLKNWGFKAVYHIMPNLPGSTPAKDLLAAKTIFTDSRFQPDQIKIYPLVVLKTAPLFKIWQAEKFKPYASQILIKLLIKIKKIIPPYIRLVRLVRDIPEQSIIAGNKMTNLRQILQNQKAQCRCIRCREAKNAEMEKIYFYKHQYPASNGQEYYLSYENKTKTKLYAHLRLRFPSPKSVFRDSAIIREVHAFGLVAPIMPNTLRAIQHRGLGKNLMAKAEELAATAGYKKIMVISGVGAREYYRKLGYRIIQYGYMMKNLHFAPAKTKSRSSLRGATPKERRSNLIKQQMFVI